MNLSSIAEQKIENYATEHLFEIKLVQSTLSVLRYERNKTDWDRLFMKYTKCIFIPPSFCEYD